MSHKGDFDTSAVIYGKFTTTRPSTGAPFTLAGTPALSVYKDNSTTQSTTGVTLTADFDGVTGLNHFAIDTSADGTFYSAGSFFEIVITTGTVDSVSAVGFVVASFTLRKDSSLKPTTAGRALDVSAGGEAGIDWANIGSPTTAVNLSATNIDVDQVVASVSGAVGSVTGAVGSVTGAVGSIGAGGITAASFAANAITAAKLDPDVTTELQAGLATAAALATVDSIVDDIIVYVDAILTDTAEIGAAGAGLTNINLPNQTMDIVGNITGNLSGSVGSVTGLTAADVGAIKAKTDNLPSDPADASVIAGRFDTLDTSVGDLPTNAELATALGTADDAVKTVVDAIKVQTDKLTFTVANQIDANLQYINDVAVTGDGVSPKFGV
jgi:hypothetical protein